MIKDMGVLHMKPIEREKEVLEGLGKQEKMVSIPGVITVDSNGRIKLLGLVIRKGKKEDK